jgi:integral membrane protein
MMVRVAGALLRYRVIAYVVGVVLLVLAFVAMPVKYIGGDPALVALVGPVHGFLYMVYLVATFDLGRRMDWPLKRMALVMLAGTVPFLSFVAERWITRRVRASRREADDVTAPAAPVPGPTESSA